MFAKLFVLGGPGSGKSTIARLIEDLLDDKVWTCERINDYPILQTMVEEDYDKPERWLRWIDENDKRKGFDVLNIQVFDEALRRLELDVRKRFSLHESVSNQPYLALIEFSRNDYEWAFQQFDSKFLHNAHFIYLKTELEVCKQRIHQRARHPMSDDDYDVSDYIFQTYYDHDNGEQLAEFVKHYGISDNNVLLFDNNSEIDFVLRTDTFTVLKKVLEDFIDRAILISEGQTGMLEKSNILLPEI